MKAARPSHQPKSSDFAQKGFDIGHWCLDLVNDRLYWSEETYRIFGIKKEEFLPYYRTFYNAVHPDDRSHVFAHREKFLKGEIPMNMVHRIVLPDGEIRYVHQTGERIVDLSNRLIALTGTVREIGRWGAANDSFTKLPSPALQSARPVAVVDEAGYVSWANGCFLRTFEFDLTEVVGRAAGSFLQGPDTLPGATHYLRGRIQQKKCFAAEMLSYSKNGKKYWMLVKGQPIIDKTGECTGFFVTYDHLTGIAVSHLGTTDFAVADRRFRTPEFHQKAIVGPCPKSGIGKKEKTQPMAAATALESTQRRDRHISWLDNMPAISAAVASNASEALASISKLLSGRVPQTMRLRSSVKTLIRQITTTRQMAILLDSRDFSEKGISRKVKLNVFRVIQEQLGNIVKYSNACEVTVSLRRTAETIYLVIRDNGWRINLSQKKGGLCITDIVECAEMNGGKAAIKFEEGVGNLLDVAFAIFSPGADTGLQNRFRSPRLASLCFKS